MSEQQPHYSMVIEWSEDDAAYIVSFPEWEAVGHLALTHGASYMDAARKGAEMLDFLVWSRQQDGEPLPKPREFTFDAHSGSPPPDRAQAAVS